jgi:translocation and assembly module TamB
MRRPPVVWVLGGSLAALVGLALVGVLVLTHTDRGRERVRLFAVEALAERVDGQVAVERLSGNLLTGATLEGVRIADRSGAPFLSADSLVLRYSIRSLISRELLFSDLRLVRPRIVLDRPPGGRWNVERLFPSPAAAPLDGSAPPAGNGAGFGAWVRLEDVEIVDGTVVVRQPWLPGDPAAADSLARARPRLRLARVPGGWQTVWELRDLDAELPFVRLAHPDSAGRRVDVARLRATALPFRPPAARVRGLSGTLTLVGDTLRVRDLRIELPASRIRAEGRAVLGGSELSGRARVEALALEDLRWLRPDLPEGGGKLDEIVVRGAGDTLDMAATGIELAVGEARVAGDTGIRLAGVTVLGPTDLQFAAVDTRLIERLAPAIDVPVDGALDGHLRAAGPAARLEVDGRVAFRERDGATSVLLVDGLVDASTGDARANGLRVDLDPLRVSVLRSVRPGLPLEGTLTGHADLTGSLDDLHASLDVTHHARSGTSRLVGGATWAAGDPARLDVDVRAPELSLATLGRFAPAAGLRGRARGTIEARGTTDDLVVSADLRPERGGRLEVAGRVGLDGTGERYDLEGRLAAFDAATVSTHPPSTHLTGTFSLRGRGVDPASATAEVRVDLTDTRVDGTEADSTHLVVRVADGLATAERVHVRMASATADLEGRFGLVEGRSGELRYRVRVDSLADFRAYLPADTGVAPPRPAMQARALARARADSARIAEATAVERMATGQPAPPGLALDAAHALPRDSVSGTLIAEGVVTGQVRAFDVEGTALAEQIVAAGSHVAHAEARYALAGVGGADATVRLDASADSVLAGGFGFDSLGVRVDHRGGWRRGTGTADVGVFQDPDRDYRAAVEFRLELDRSEALLTEMAMRFDTITWSSTGPGTIAWGDGGTEVHTIELESDRGGRILVDGVLPLDEVADLRIELDRVQLAHLSGLLQDSVTTEGLLTLDATLAGTRASPRLEGTATLDEAELRGRGLPRAEVGFAYADRLLALDAVFVSDSLGTLTAEARVPVDLALEREPGPRLLERPLEAILVADSLALDALPSFTAATADVRGRLRGRIEVAGTPADPRLAGGVELDVESIRLVEPNVTLERASGALRFDGDRATIDSLVATSGGGGIRVTGGVDLTTLARPTLDLEVAAAEAVVLDNRWGRVRADVDLTVDGPIQGLSLSGDVLVLRGVLYAPETSKRRLTDLDDPATLQGLGGDDGELALLPQTNPLLDSLRLDLDVIVERDTWVRNSDGNVEISTSPEAGPLHVSMAGGPETLSLVGTINADRGEYSYAGNRFQLTAGSATFLPGSGGALDPLLQLSAQKRIQQSGREALVIQIHVLGTLTEPRIALESNAQPPLPESDLLAYLAFGESSSSLLDLNDTGVTSESGLRALSVVAQQQFASVGLGAALDEAVSEIEREGTRGGLDVLRIHPAPLPSEFAFERYFDNVLRGTEVEAGKYLGDRLFVAGHARLSSPVPGVRVEYGLATGLTWEAAWEPRYLPSEPTLSADATATEARTLGTFLIWKRRF